MKGAAELIIHAALGHLAASMRHDLQGLFRTGAVIDMQKELERHGRRKLGRTAKTAVGGIVVLCNPPIRAVENLCRQQLA